MNDQIKLLVVVIVAMVAVIGTTVGIVSLRTEETKVVYVQPETKEGRSDVEFVKKEMERKADKESAQKDLVDEFKVEFIVGCADGGVSTKKECGCMYDEIIALDNGFLKLVEMSLKIANNEDLTTNEVTAIVDAVYACSE